MSWLSKLIAGSFEPEDELAEGGWQTDMRLAFAAGEFVRANELAHTGQTSQDAEIDELAALFLKASVANERKDWDEAAEILSNWSTDYPERYMKDATAFLNSAANCSARGFTLVEFLASPETQTHPSYDSLLEDGLRQVTKALRLVQGPGAFGDPPVKVTIDFDRAYAELASARNLNRFG